MAFQMTLWEIRHSYVIDLNVYYVAVRGMSCKSKGPLLNMSNGPLSTLVCYEKFERI